MSLPKKIYPDNIKDSIVEIRYNSDVPFEIALGKFFDALDNSYYYSNRHSAPFVLPDGRQIDISAGIVNMFHNTIIKFEFRPNSIIFNCLDEYKGWEIYEREIFKALDQLSNADIFKDFHRVGVRYISEYANFELTDNTKFSFKFGFPNIKSNSYSFRCNFETNGLRIGLNLNNKVEIANPIANFQKADISKISLIDIDVIKEDFKCTKVNQLMQIVNECHDTEKYFFFGLLSDEYLNSIKKEY